MGYLLYLRRTIALRQLYIRHFSKNLNTARNVGNVDRGERWLLMTKGATRTVLLTKRYAIKIPGSWFNAERWPSFLLGLVCNMREHMWSNAEGNERLCPVLFYIPGGFLVVMPRARTLTKSEWSAFDYTAFTQLQLFYENVEEKMDSFGWYNGQIVAVDYG